MATGKTSELEQGETEHPGSNFSCDYPHFEFGPLVRAYPEEHFHCTRLRRKRESGTFIATNRWFPNERCKVPEHNRNQDASR